MMAGGSDLGMVGAAGGSGLGMVGAAGVGLGMVGAAGGVDIAGGTTPVTGVSGAGLST